MKQIKLNMNEQRVLKTFKMFKKCPSMKVIAGKVKLSPEYVRCIMWKLVSYKLINVNKRAKARKFYV